MPVWIKESVQKMLLDELMSLSKNDFNLEDKIYFQNIIYHMPQARIISPFEDAAILTMDGVGEATTPVFIGEENNHHN